MDDLDTNDAKHQDLWRWYRDEGSMPATELNLKGMDERLALAAYLDGRLDEAERAQVEAWLAGRPEQLELLLASREALTDSGGPAPDALVQQACALVADRPGALAGLFRATAGLFAPRLRLFAWSGTLAAMVFACLLGFQLGESGYHGALTVEKLLAREAGSVLGQGGDEII